MFKNWPEISKIRCQKIRLAIATCKDEAALEKLQADFPGMFSSKPTVISVPKSVLLKALPNYIGPVGEPRRLGAICEERFGIPVFMDWNAGMEPIPDEAKKRLIGQKLDYFMPFQVEGLDFLTIDAPWLRPSRPRVRRGDLVTSAHFRTGGMNVASILAEYVILDK